MRWRWPGRDAVCRRLAALVACALSSLACAQLLDLGNSGMPEAGEGLAALEIAGALTQQADDLTAGTGDDGGVVALRKAVRSVAAALLRAGEAQGPDGSAMIQLGRRLAWRMDELDRTIEAHASAPERRLMATALVRLAEAPPDDIAAAERALRNALAPLTAGVGMPGPGDGWFGSHDAAHEPPQPAWLERLDAPAISRLDAVLAAAEHEPAYAPSAHRLRLRLGRIGDALFAPPAWLDGATAASLEADLIAAAGQVLDPELRDRGVAELDRLAAIGDLLPRIDALPVDNRVRDLHDALGALIERSRTDRRGTEPSFAALDRALALLDIDDLLSREDELERVLRPAWRIAERDARLATTRLRDGLAEVVRRERPMSSPAVLAMLAERRASVAMLKHLLSLSAHLRSTPDSPSRNLMQRRLLDLGRELDRRDAESAVEELRRFAGELGRFTSMRGEGELRALLGGDPTPAQAVIQNLHADRAGVVLEQLDAQRERWTEAWARGEDEAVRDAAARLDGLAVWIGIVADRALIAADPDAANTWPGWLLSAEAQRLLLREADEELRVIATQVIASRPDRAAARAGERSRELAVVRVWAAVTRACAEAGATSDAHVLHRVALGPPDDRFSWGAAARAACADVCRYAEELAHAARSGERLAAEELGGVVARQAERAWSVLSAE